MMCLERRTALNTWNKKGQLLDKEANQKKQDEHNAKEQAQHNARKEIKKQERMKREAAEKKARDEKKARATWDDITRLEEEETKTFKEAKATAASQASDNTDEDAVQISLQNSKRRPNSYKTQWI